LIATDGFQFYKRVVRRILGPACLYGQVIKTRRNDRIVKIERRALIGDAWRFEETLRELRGFLETEHVFRRAAEPHDPIGLGISFSAECELISARTLVWRRKTKFDEAIAEGTLHCRLNWQPNEDRRQ
jgi:hypothetical protein